MSRWMCRSFALLVLAILVCASASSAFAQKKKKQDDTKTEPAPDPMASMPDEQRIDYLISEMLAAWQINDIDQLHKNIADDMVAVNGMWAPPVVGWANYLQSYRSQRARTQQVRLDRTNTLIRTSSNTAWACYQWQFTGVVDGQQSASRGQTTLVLEKRGDKWLIVHNHTSIAETLPTNVPASSQPQPEAIGRP